MKLNRMYVYIIIIFALIASGCSDTYNVRDNDEITDVRITIEETDRTTSQYSQTYYLLRIKYGYCSNDEWTDIPHEEYDLVGID